MLVKSNANVWSAVLQTGGQMESPSPITEVSMKSFLILALSIGLAVVPQLRQKLQDLILRHHKPDGTN